MKLICLAAAVLAGLVVSGCRSQDALDVSSCESLDSADRPVEITRVDLRGEPVDWFEIFNNSDAHIDLTGWHFSDDRARPKRATFPQGSSIAPRRHLRFFVSRDQFGFALGDGEELVLADPAGNEIDFVDWSGADSPLDVAECTPVAARDS